MSCLLTANGQSMGSPWTFYGQSMGSPWGAGGMPVGCPCHEQEMIPIFKSNNIDRRNLVHSLEHLDQVLLYRSTSALYRR